LKPKRSRSAYVYYVSDRIGQLKEKQPELNVGALMKQLAELWPKLTEGEKKVKKAVKKNDIKKKLGLRRESQS
jgi:hypothetical protein